MLRQIKLAGLQLAESLGLNSRILESRWRQQRLLILCYHGVSLEDEHEWAPGLYLPPSLFRARMEALRERGCAVLPLDEALRRLYAGELPRKSVALTFDDGGHDFYRVAYPILREYRFPVTLYLTTYYSLYNRPVFDVMFSYLLWKGGNRRLSWPEFLSAPVLLDARGRSAVQLEVRARIRKAGLSAREKDLVLGALAVKLDLDYEALCARRLLHLMTLDEVKEVARAGVDVQLHTHRHRVPRRKDSFLQEIQDNRRWIAAASPVPAVHFCYPCGICLPEFGDFLEAAGIASATTCDIGLARAESSRFLLPRVLDTAGLAPHEFAGWLSGLADLLPRRQSPRPTELLDELAPSG